MKNIPIKAARVSLVASSFVAIFLSPIGGGLGKLFRLGKLPVNTQLAAYSNVVKPRQGGADWQLRFQVQFPFPK